MMSIINLERERDYRSKILEKDSLISCHITYWFLKMFGTDKWEKLSLLPNSKKKNVWIYYPYAPKKFLYE